MTKARTNASASPAVGRNMVINGAMNVAQRSVSETGLGAATGYFTCDRWFMGENDASAGRLTMTQTADGPVGFANCLKLDCTTADTSIASAENLLLRQTFEGQDLQQIKKGTSDAESVTVSFYVKANAAFTFGVELEDLDNGRQITKLFNTTTGWVRHEFVIPADVDDGSSPFDDDNASSLSIQFWLHAGATFAGGTLNTTAWANITNANRAAGIDSLFSSTDNNFFITGVQMEVGSVATPFEHRSFGEELALCQRYFQRQFPPSAVGTTNGSTAVGRLTTPYIQIMRASPSITVVGTMQVYAGTHASTFTALGAFWSTPNKVEYDVVCAGTIQNGHGQSAVVYNSGSDNSTSETSYGFQIDAEL